MNKERRNKIKKAISLMEQANEILTNVKNEEEIVYDNMPENLQNSIRGMDSQDSIDCLDSVISLIEDTILNIRESVDELYNIS